MPWSNLAISAFTWKNENNLFFSKSIAAYDLKVGRCIELNILMNLHQYKRSMSFFDLSPVSVFKVKSFFSKTVELFETKYHVNDFGSTEIIIYTNGLGHMTKTAVTPIYGKKTFKTLLIQNQRADFNELVMQHQGCGPIIIYSNYDPSLFDLEIYYGKVKFGHEGICMKKKELFFLKTIAAYDIKVGRCIELNDFVKLHEYHRARSLFDFRQRSLRFQI